MAAPFFRLFLFCIAFGSPLLRAAPEARPSAGHLVINVRDLGAIGDGRIHSVSEWLSSGKFSNLRAIQRTYPFVDDTAWTIDEVAFEQARLSLPAEGGTIYLPAGHYVAGRHGWRILAR